MSLTEHFVINRTLMGPTLLVPCIDSLFNDILSLPLPGKTHKTFSRRWEDAVQTPGPKVAHWPPVAISHQGWEDQNGDVCLRGLLLGEKSFQRPSSASMCVDSSESDISSVLEVARPSHPPQDTSEQAVSSSAPADVQVCLVVVSVRASGDFGRLREMNTRVADQGTRLYLALCEPLCL